MGIAGSDVSKEAADMVLLDDNFASIVNGIEEGRLIFDNLKKSISYTLSSNIPELIPFVLFIILNFPLLLSTIHILLIDVGTDVLPAISFAYEKSESDIMLRRPRRANIDRLVNRRLISFSYFQIGITQALAGVFVGMTVLHDYGLSYGSLPFSNSGGHWLASKQGNLRWMYTVRPNGVSKATDIKFFAAKTKEVSLFFSSTQEGFARQEQEVFSDLKVGSPQFNNMFKIIGSVTGAGACRSYSCEIPEIGSVTNDVRCFGPSSTNIAYGGIGNAEPVSKTERCFDLWSNDQQREVLIRAQTAYLVSIIQVQWADGIISKTRILSVFQQGLKNTMFNIGLVSETALGALFVFVPPLNTAFQTRQLGVRHIFLALPFAIFIFAYDETRKLLMRFGDRGGQSPLSKFGRFVKEYSYW